MGYMYLVKCSSMYQLLAILKYDYHLVILANLILFACVQVLGEQSVGKWDGYHCKGNP